MKIKKFNDFKIKVPIEVKELSDIFIKNGKRLYIVGGYVRDTLMGLDPLDIDLTTDSLPDETITFLKGKYHIDLVGKAFGVIIVHLGNMKIEIASFRTDETMGRHPIVKLGASIEEDCARRDLTISALFYDIEEGKIVDLVGGIDDIKNKVIRMVGNPKDRIEEDQLRVLRVARFSARYDFTIDSNTSNVIKSSVNLSEISRERIFEEINKAYKQSIDFSKYLELFTKLGLWEEIFPGFKLNKKIEHTKFLETYIANIFKHENTNGLLTKLVQDFKMDISTTRVAIFLIELLEINTDNMFDFYKKKISTNTPNDTILEWFRLNRLKGSIYTYFLKYMPSVSAKDLMDNGFKGAELGREIKRLETEKIKKFCEN